MNALLFITILYVNFDSFSFKPAPGCNYNVDGVCMTQCPNGTHPYSSGCKYLTKEQTCTTPFPQEDLRGKLCDYNTCYCDTPTVKYNKKCIKLEECPTVNECPKGTYLYSVENSNITPEPSCADPCPDEDDTYGKVAKYTACYCLDPYVRDYAGQCIDFNKCPTKEE